MKKLIVVIMIFILSSCGVSYVRTQEKSIQSNIEDLEGLKSKQIALFVDVMDEERDETINVEALAFDLFTHLKISGFNVLSYNETEKLLKKYNLSKEDLLNPLKKDQVIQKLKIDVLFLVNYKQESDMPLESPGGYSETEKDSLVVFQRNISFNLIEIQSGKTLGILNMVKMPDEQHIHKMRNTGIGWGFHGAGIVVMAFGALIDGAKNTDWSGSGGKTNTYDGITTGVAIAIPLVIIGIAIQSITYAYQYNETGFDENEIINRLNPWLSLKMPSKPQIIFPKKVKEQKEEQKEEKEKGKNNEIYNSFKL